MAAMVLNPEHMMRNWQSRTIRVLRAQERLSQGMLAAARAELRFGQEFLTSRLGLLRWDAAEPGHMSEQAQRDLENLVSVMREVSEEIRSGFSEAAEMLRGEPGAAAEEETGTAGDVAARQEPEVSAKEAAEKAGERTAKMAEEAADRVEEAPREAMAKTEEVTQTAQAETSAAIDDAAETAREAARTGNAADEAA